MTERIPLTASTDFTSMTASGTGGTAMGRTNFSYDLWGRMTGKTLGGKSASYSYAYGDKLVDVSTNHFDEAGVDYDYRGDAKRHERVAGGTKRFSWDSDWGNVSEENGSGTLERMYVGNMAHVDGVNPASGAYAYYLQDHLGSTRYVYDQSKDLVGEFEYTPYGGSYLDSGAADITMRFTGHGWDARSGLYFAPYRYYNPAAARWVSRDPLGMVDGTNVYGYVGGNPLMRHDIFGLKADDDEDEEYYRDKKDDDEGYLLGRLARAFIGALKGFVRHYTRKRVEPPVVGPFVDAAKGAPVVADLGLRLRNNRDAICYVDNQMIDDPGRGGRGEIPDNFGPPNQSRR